MGLISVTNNSSSCLLGISTPTNASWTWFTRQRYRVPLKGCSTPRFQISSKTEVHLGILLGLYTTWEPKGDVRYSKEHQGKWKPAFYSTGGPASFSHFLPKHLALGSCLEVPWREIKRRQGTSCLNIQADSQEEVFHLTRLVESAFGAPSEATIRTPSPRLGQLFLREFNQEWPPWTTYGPCGHKRPLVPSTWVAWQDFTLTVHS